MPHTMTEYYSLTYSQTHHHRVLPINHRLQLTKMLPLKVDIILHILHQLRENQISPQKRRKESQVHAEANKNATNSTWTTW